MRRSEGEEGGKGREVGVGEEVGVVGTIKDRNVTVKVDGPWRRRSEGTSTRFQSRGTVVKTLWKVQGTGPWRYYKQW